MDPSDVERELRGLAERVQALEERLAPATVAVSAPRPQLAAPASTTDLLPSLGRSLLALAAAYLLRALVDSRTFPAGPGISIGIAYALAWLVWAARTPADRRL